MKRRKEKKCPMRTDEIKGDEKNQWENKCMLPEIAKPINVNALPVLIKATRRKKESSERSRHLKCFCHDNLSEYGI